MKEWEDRLSVDVKLTEIESKSVNEQVNLILKRRLQYEEAYMPRWREAMLLGAMPQNVSVTGQRVFSTMNTMWDMLGDKSTGMQWYMKRIIAAEVFAAAEIYMVHDGSREFRDTWEFLDTQLVGQNFEEAMDLVGLWYKHVGAVGRYIYPKYS